MKMSKEKLWRTAERMLKRTEPYQDNRDLEPEENYRLQYLLVKGDPASPEQVLAYAGTNEEMISFQLFGETKLSHYGDWAFDFESDLFEYLEQGYQLAGMSREAHYGVWCTIEDWQGEIEHTDGMQKYLGYCKRNGVTQELMQREEHYSGMDVMTLYEGKAAERPQAARKQAYER